MTRDYIHLKKTARLAGIIYLIGGITAAYSMLNPPWKTVSDNNAMLIQRILKNEMIYRTQIFSSLAAAILFLLLVHILYRIFKDVDKEKAKLVIAFTIVQIPIAFVLEIFRIIALLLLKNELLKSMEHDNVQDLAILFIKCYQYGIVVLTIFWGLWLIPFGQLVYKSGFMLKGIGILLILGGCAYIIESATELLFPGFKNTIVKFTSIFYSLAEFSTILFLLIFGVNKKVLAVHENR